MTICVPATAHHSWSISVMKWASGCWYRFTSTRTRCGTGVGLGVGAGVGAPGGSDILGVGTGLGVGARDGRGVTRTSASIGRSGGGSTISSMVAADLVHLVAHAERVGPHGHAAEEDDRSQDREERTPDGATAMGGHGHAPGRFRPPERRAAAPACDEASGPAAA